MTYLEAVNDLLVRLREPEVETARQTHYSKLICKFINDSKRRVENSFNWNALTATITVQTVAGVFEYVLDSTNNRFRIIDVINDTDNHTLTNKPIAWLNKQFLMADTVAGSPNYYGFNGVSPLGYANIDIYPIPDRAYNIRVNVFLPQNDLVSDGEIILCPSELVIEGAYAMALAERGEDQGLSTSEALLIYRSSLADAIAIETSRYVEYDSWESV